VSRHPLRRAQLIRPFGVGATTTFPDGVSLMVAGLDHWYREPAAGKPVNLDDFRIEEWRLQKRLGVDHLRLPPDHRPAWRNRDARFNVDLTIPALRFPQQHVCRRCSRLHEVSLTHRGRKRCPSCETDGRFATMVQVQFVAMCERGHVQDFPFQEWAHRSTSPACHLPLRMYGTSGASLLSVFVSCACGARRNLAGATDAIDTEHTVLSYGLESEDSPYLCRGARPWLGGHHDEGCSQSLRGGLRSAANVYFANTASSVYVPREHAGVPPDVAASLDEPPVSTWLRTLRDVQVEPTAEMLRGRFPGLIPDSVDDDSLDVLLAGGTGQTRADDPEPETEEQFRLLEYQALSGPRNDDRLTVRVPDTPYEPWLTGVVDKICLVERLRVTSAFTGFSRIRSDEETTSRDDLDRRAEMLWAQPPPPAERWLPASIVFGEGIFLRFDQSHLSSWVNRPDVIERAARLDETYSEVARHRRLADRTIPPSLIALHTFAHVLIDQLAFEAGYSAASLAERLYVSEMRGMAGLLIYTAAGDSEGTLGGLVRLGQPGLLEPIVQHALERTTWCSSDPVCAELGDAGGQGPDSCNLAACHDCAVLPETACEEFNRFLDRQLLASPATGLFDAETLKVGD
jgi:hypothetical protein